MDKYVNKVKSVNFIYTIKRRTLKAPDNMKQMLANIYFKEGAMNPSGGLFGSSSSNTAGLFGSSQLGSSSTSTGGTSSGGLFGGSGSSTTLSSGVFVFGGSSNKTASGGIFSSNQNKPSSSVLGGGGSSAFCGQNQGGSLLGRQ